MLPDRHGNGMVFFDTLISLILHVRALSLPWLLGWLCTHTCRTNAVQLVYLFLTVKILNCSNWGCCVWVLGQCFFVLENYRQNFYYF